MNAFPLALVLCAPAASAAVQLAADVALIQPYSYELQNKEPFRAPFYAVFRRGKKELWYVAAQHGGDPRSATFALIRAVFRTHPPDAALIEGVKADRGENPESLIADYRASSGRSYKWGEPSFTALQAVDHGKVFAGAEPEDTELLSRVTALGYTREDLLGFFFLRQIPQMLRDGTLAKEGPEKSYDELMEIDRRSLGLSPGDAPTYARFLAWYRGKMGTDPDLAPRDYEGTAPLADGTPIQRISAVIDKARNQAMVEQIARMLHVHDRVLVVLGASHLAVQRKALEAMLGPAVEQSDRPPR
jgi:hypothetical protein